MTSTDVAPQGSDLLPLLDKLDHVIDKMQRVRAFARPNYLPRLLDLCRRVLQAEGGFHAVFERAEALDKAGLFEGSDWQHPESLQAHFVQGTFAEGDLNLVLIECLSEVRFLAISSGRYFHPDLSAEQAEHFLTRVLAFNLHELFDLTADEVKRTGDQAARALITRHLNFVAAEVGMENILDQVVSEVSRLLRQRPIQLTDVHQMVNRIAAYLFDPDLQLATSARGAESLVSALYGPTHASREDPGVPAYLESIATLDDMALDSEAQGFARAMHDTGLVSPYHAAFLRHVMAREDTELFSRALGLSTTGRDCFLCFQELVYSITEHCIHVETAQTVYGLACLLERALLYRPSIAAAFWRQMSTPLHTNVRTQLTNTFGPARKPEEWLLAGVVNVLGQPLGLGQGNNPACQSTRAISMWSYTEPDYLLQLVRWASRDDCVVMHFEGEHLNSADMVQGMVNPLAFDLDPLSTVLVPHLDRIYTDMGQRSAGRGEDPHRWINPEFHGWWVNRGFAIAVDINTGLLQEPLSFVRTFYALYHPHYNSQTPVVHPQPAGVAVTDSQARFIGWHAITILRVAMDQNEVMRVYFFNPNNDGGQNWGNGVQVSTEGSGEQHGECSLPIEEFVSRLYIFHYDVTDWQLHTQAVPDYEIETVYRLMTESWAVERVAPVTT